MTLEKHSKIQNSIVFPSKVGDVQQLREFIHLTLKAHQNLNEDFFRGICALVMNFEEYGQAV
jgi:hypothetical protein